MKESSSSFFDFKQQGYCCSQAMLQLGIEQKEGENQGVIDAAGALCGGFYTGKLCGVLTGGACLLCYLEPQKAVDSGLIAQLFDWFEKEFSAIDCLDLLGDDPMAKMEVCPVLFDRTYEKVMELLDGIGYEP